MEFSRCITPSDTLPSSRQGQHAYIERGQVLPVRIERVVVELDELLFAKSAWSVHLMEPGFAARFAAVHPGRQRPRRIKLSEARERTYSRRRRKLAMNGQRCYYVFGQDPATYREPWCLSCKAV